MTFNGQVLVVVRADSEARTIKVSASAAGYERKVIDILVNKNIDINFKY